MSNSRMNAIKAVTNYKPIEKPLNFSETPSKDLFGINVFSDAVMRERLPKAVYKAMTRTIEKGEILDITLADDAITGAGTRRRGAGRRRRTALNRAKDLSLFLRFCGGGGRIQQRGLVRLPHFDRHSGR